MLIAGNEAIYVSTSCAFHRESYVSMAVGRLVDGHVPDSRWSTGIPVTAIAWQATGDRDASLALGSCSDDSPDALDAAVGKLADALGRYGGPLLSGDVAAWDRAAELVIAQ